MRDGWDEQGNAVFVYDPKVDSKGKRRRENPTPRTRLMEKMVSMKTEEAEAEARQRRAQGEAGADAYVRQWLEAQHRYRHPRGLPDPTAEEVERVRTQYLDACAAGPRTKAKRR